VLRVYCFVAAGWSPLWPLARLLYAAVACRPSSIVVLLTIRRVGGWIVGYFKRCCARFVHLIASQSIGCGFIYALYIYVCVN